jgi:hypothetical protein
MKILSSVLILLLFPVWLRAQAYNESVKPTTANGHPALLFPRIQNSVALRCCDQGNVTVEVVDQPASVGTDLQYTLVERSGTDSQPVYEFHLWAFVGNGPGPGLLVVSKDKVKWLFTRKQDEKRQFDLPLSEISVRGDHRVTVIAVVGKSKYIFIGLNNAREATGPISSDNLVMPSSRMADFLYLALTNYPAAEEEFWRLHGDALPPAAMATFREQATAWRALSVKPELPEETRKQRMLAESYLRDKDFKGSIEHYRLAVRADATWPEGWFNLAALYAETGEYASAVASMKNYLELMPNSSDAAAARDKIVVWEDKAAQPRSQQ